MAADADLDELIAEGERAYGADEPERAIELFLGAYERAPENGRVCAGLGQSYLKSGDLGAAGRYLEQALRAMPNDARMLNLLGYVYGQTGRFEDAETCFRKLMRFGGGDDQTLSNLGSVLNELGRFDEAERTFRTALRRDRGNIQARYNLGLLQLLKGDFAAGWDGFELRQDVMGYPKKGTPGAQPWQGEDVSGKTVALYAEQGLGDAIQFARYATLVKERGADVIVQCNEALANLLASIDGVGRTVRSMTDADDADYFASLLSMPKLFGTTHDTVPAPSPYISASPALPDAAHHGLRQKGGKLRIGLVWAGNPNHKSDRKRSIRLEQLSPLLGCDGAAFFSLQIGAAVAQLDDVSAGIRPDPVFASKQSLDDVASVLLNLDLLISVDTSLAHLAGALGVPVWTLISYYPDWRWLLARDDTPWYPAMRLFRQPSPGDWAGAINGAALALNEMIAAKNQS